MTKPSPLNKIAAWLVHIFTACGLVAGFMSILAINNGEWRLAMIWLVGAGIIDGIDGTLARLLKVKEVLPNVDGKTIDTVVDFVNYAVVPAYLLYMAEVFPDVLNVPLTALILLTSAIYYGKEGMILDDKYFIGFPVLWNVLAFYILFVYNGNPFINATIIVLFAILHFVPLKFPYPSRKSQFQKWHLFFSVILFLAMIFILYFYPSENLMLSIIAYLCAAYFMGMAIYNTYFK